MPKSTHPVTRRSVLIVTIMAVFVVSALAIRDFIDPFNDAPFDKVVWAWDVGDRMEMARAAVSSVKPGMSESLVVQLLGQPDETYPTSERILHFGESLPLNADTTLVYWLGGSVKATLRGLDSAFVYVHFESGKVIEAEIGGG